MAFIAGVDGAGKFGAVTTGFGVVAVGVFVGAFGLGVDADDAPGGRPCWFAAVAGCWFERDFSFPPAFEYRSNT